MSEKKAPKIFIVDNHQDTLNLLTTMFEAAGAIVTNTTDPEKAVKDVVSRAGSENSFDMVVTDIVMPGKTGFQAAEEMRAGGYKGPIIAFTATTSGLGKKEGDAAGVTTYLSKETLKPDLIEALISQHCK